MRFLLTVFLILSAFIFTEGCKSGKKTDGTIPGAELTATGEEDFDEAGEVRDNRLQKIHFDYDKFNVRSDAIAILEKNAQYLKENPNVWVQVEGHCDERGSAEYNLALGEKRANAAKNYLVGLGIPARRITVISYGEEKPLENGSDEYAWSMNRRAEFIIISQR